MKSKQQWFVEPREARTNKVIAETANPEDAYQLTNEDGYLVDVWQLEWRQVAELIGSQKFLNLNFRLWGRRGVSGQIKNYAWLLNKLTKQAV